MLRKLIAVFFVVLILEGAVRKWLLPQYGSEIFLVKDFVLLTALTAYLIGRYRPARVRDLWIWALWTAIVLAQALVSGPSLQTLVGLRYYLAPLPILLIVPALLQGVDDLDLFARWAVRVSFPIGLLAIIQYNSPVDSVLNTYAWGNDGGIATFGVESADFESVIEHARVTGPFSYISTFAAFLSAAWILAWLSLLHSRGRRDSVLAGLSIVLTFVNMGMNGSRSLLAFAAFTGVPLLLVFLVRHGLMRSRGFLVSVAVGLAIAASAAAILRPAEMTLQRGDTQEGLDRALNMISMPLATLDESSWLGAGMGSTFGGYEALGMTGAQGFDEIHVDRIGLELGVVGYVFIVVAKLIVFWRTFGLIRRAPAGPIRDWAVIALVIQLNPPWSIPFYNSIAAILYFAAVALVYWLDMQVDRMRALSAASHSAGRMSLASVG
jgi:hypothetical protein